METPLGNQPVIHFGAQCSHVRLSKKVDGNFTYA